MIDKEKEKKRNLKKYKKKREVTLVRGGKIVIGTLCARELRRQGKRYCPRCKKVKTFRCFNKSKYNKGFASHCRLCCRELGKKYYNHNMRKEKYNGNKDIVRNDRLKRRFGITLDEYNIKLHEQNDKCKICKKTIEENGKALAVDHNHENGEVRDLLCANCNAAIGFMQENILIAKKMVKYIERWTK